MTSDSAANFNSLVPRLRDDLSFSNRKQGRGLTHMLEIKSESLFFSIGEAEYRLICHLDGKQTLREAFEKHIESEPQYPDEANDNRLTWEKTVQLFNFLRLQNLLATINGQPVQQSQAESGKLVNNVNPYGFRLKLFDANSIATGLTSRFGSLFTRFALTIWIFVNAWAISLLLGNSGDIVADTKVVIQPENWIWLTLCWIFLKVIHESAHAVCCKRLGGHVGEAGINFLLLLPMPYVDVSSSWKFESKWKRIYVALAGIYVELFVASIFVFVWAYGNNPVVDSIAVQMILMASLSTVVFNINPLMKFDGYFVLSDLLGRPNLAINGSTYQKSWLKKTLFGIRPSVSLYSYDFLTKVYGWLATLWKILIAVGLIFAAAKLFHGAGIILAALAIFIFYLKPLFQFLPSLFSSNAIQPASKIRCLTSLSVCAVLFWCSTWVPWPFAPTAVGVIDYSEKHVMRAPSDGFLVKILVRHGQHVKQGDRLAEIENLELVYEFRSLQIDREYAVTELRQLRRDNKLAEYQAQLTKIKELDQQIEILRQQTGRLSLVAPHDGYVVASELANFQDAFFKQGEEIMKVVGSNSLEVVSCANEFDVQLFRNSSSQKVTVELESGQKIESILDRVEPTAVQQIFHPALSAENGGPLAVQARSSSGDESRDMELTRPVFKVTTASLSTENGDIGALKVGQRCRVYLDNSSHSCFNTLCHKLTSWLRSNWEAGSAE